MKLIERLISLFRVEVARQERQENVDHLAALRRHAENQRRIAALRADVARIRRDEGDGD